MFASGILVGGLLLASGFGQSTSAPAGSADVTGEPGRRISRSAYDVTPLPKETIAALAAVLDPEVFRVTQNDGTEPAFCGTLLDNKKDGIYTCVVCGLPLFTSENKFVSGTGWPSFDREFDPEHVGRVVDRSGGMVRTEINCARCTAHLGHVFNDGPETTGERHCLNSASLVFYEEGDELPEQSRPIETATAYFAGGCFWGLEHYFQQGPGVINVESGYMQGVGDNPDYKTICRDKTGHAETVKVTYDPSKITYARLLEAFFDMHDPTELNRQGPDVGTQYRSGIWFADEEQQREAEAFVMDLRASKRFSGPIVTQVEPAQTFWLAEEYHQDYIANTGRACHVKNPW